MQKIAFLDANDIVSTVTLDGTQYQIRMLWNDRGGYWTLSLRSDSGASLLEGVKAVPDYPLLHPYRGTGIPPGELMVVTLDTTLQIVGRTDFASSKAMLVYVTEAELNAI